MVILNDQTEAVFDGNEDFYYFRITRKVIHPVLDFIQRAYLRRGSSLEEVTQRAGLQEH